MTCSTINLLGTEKREIRPPSRYQFVYYVFAQVESDPFDKKLESYEEAIASKYSVKWFAAMQDERSSLYKNKIWNLVVKP